MTLPSTECEELCVARYHNINGAGGPVGWERSTAKQEVLGLPRPLRRYDGLAFLEQVTKVVVCRAGAACSDTAMGGNGERAGSPA